MNDKGNKDFVKQWLKESAEVSAPDYFLDAIMHQISDNPTTVINEKPIISQKGWIGIAAVGITLLVLGMLVSPPEQLSIGFSSEILTKWVRIPNMALLNIKLSDPVSYGLGILFFFILLQLVWLNNRISRSFKMHT
ncbi:hypothetical protein N9L94_04975 [Robiginitalea sp.]|jgi:hypothetical protein|nr:hypothetical protein [Robiginitalea sp.]